MANTYIALIALNTAEVAQLTHLGGYLQGINHGGVISKEACRTLIEKGLATKDNERYYATNDGKYWLRCAELEVSP